MGQFWNIQSRPVGELYRAWLKDIDHDGIIRYLDMFNAERLIVVNPTALSELLVSKAYDFIKPPQLVQGLGKILGVGVFLAEGDEHRRQRKGLNPAFAFRHVKDLYPIFWAKSSELVQTVFQHQTDLSSTDKGQPGLDVIDWTGRAALDIIGMAGLGSDFKALQDPNNELMQTYKRLFAAGRSQRALQLLSFFLPSWFMRALPIRRNNGIDAASLLIQRTCLDLIQQKKLRLEKGTAEKDILSVAIQSGSFDDSDLVNQLMTFLIAGHETSASAVSWGVCMLGAHPDVQRKLQSEIYSHLPDPRDTFVSISAKDIDSLPYLNAVCNEVLRLYPPVPVTIRVAAHDTTLCGHFMPKNTTIFIPPWAVNTDTTLWGPDAATFNPDRWLSAGKANGGADSNFSFLTFLHGPRSCIGSGFARSELACLLAAWAGAFDTTFADEKYEVAVKNALTAKPKDLRVYIKPRQVW